MDTATATIATNGFLRRHGTVTFTQVITPDEAAHMLKTMSYSNQRPLRWSKVQNYATEMAGGTFRELTQIFIAIYHGQYVILDGQHRLNAVAHAGIPHLFTVVEKEVDSEEELAQIYSTTDIGARRTPSDIYGAYDLALQFNLDKTLVDRLGAAVKFMTTGCLRTGEQVRHDSVIPLMQIYATPMQAYRDILNNNTLTSVVSAAVRRASTIAAGLLSLRYSAPKAEREGRSSITEFWIGAFTDDGLKIGDPRKAAYRHLVETRIQVSGNARGITATHPAYSVRYLGSCLNAYIKGENLKYAKVFDQEAPLNIYGVPSDPALWW